MCRKADADSASRGTNSNKHSLLQVSCCSHAVCCAAKEYPYSSAAPRHCAPRGSAYGWQEFILCPSAGPKHFWLMHQYGPNFAAYRHPLVNRLTVLIYSLSLSLSSGTIATLSDLIHLHCIAKLQWDCWRYLAYFLLTSYSLDRKTATTTKQTAGSHFLERDTKFPTSLNNFTSFCKH